MADSANHWSREFYIKAIAGTGKRQRRQNFVGDDG
jgi:hypothetical protein